jgi:vacuolar-type H+-ATPase subunit H
MRMAASGKPSGDAAVDLAINSILAAEQDARDAVENCRGQAARILAAAEARVREIGQRTERRMKAAHRIADESVARSLGLLGEGDSRNVSKTAEGRSSDLVERAVDSLVDEMLGGPS